LILGDRCGGEGHLGFRFTLDPACNPHNTINSHFIFIHLQPLPEVKLYQTAMTAAASSVPPTSQPRQPARCATPTTKFKFIAHRCRATNPKPTSWQNNLLNPETINN
jgi:hypothetical protein